MITLSSRNIALIAGFACLFVAGGAWADDDDKGLGEGLTPLGSEAAGNADGSIPPWEGGLAEPPEGWLKGNPHHDPYQADAALYTITVANMRQYASQLTETHKKLLRKYPQSYQMQVYPTRRSCTLPEYVMAATAENHEEAELENDGNDVENAKVGVPFPVPESGVEVLWNHLLHYRGERHESVASSGVVRPNGRYSMVIREHKRLFHYSDPGPKLPEHADTHFDWMIKVRSGGGRRNGVVSTLVSKIDQHKEPREGVFWHPLLRKVQQLKIEDYSHDAVVQGTDEIRLSDDAFLFNGSHSRYDWKLLGKREMIIPYNVYRPTRQGVKVEALLSGGHLNQNLIRYEKHRVWVVEATLKDDAEHAYHKRVFYVDEDSWIIVAADIYDASGKQIRGQVGFIKNAYEIPACVQDFDVSYEFESGKYHVANLKTGYPPEDVFVNLRPTDFNRAALRRESRR